MPPDQEVTLQRATRPCHSTMIPEKGVKRRAPQTPHSRVSNGQAGLKSIQYGQPYVFERDMLRRSCGSFRTRVQTFARNSRISVARDEFRPKANLRRHHLQSRAVLETEIRRDRRRWLEAQPTRSSFARAESPTGRA